MRHIEIERCTKKEKCMGTDARRHSWRHGVRDPYKCSSVGQRELAETDRQTDRHMGSYKDGQKKTNRQTA